MSIEEHAVSFSLEINVQKAYEDVRRLQTVLYRTLGLFDELGLPKDVRRQAREIQQAIAWLNQLRLAWIATQTAMGPLGWALAGLSIAGVFASGGGFDIGRRLARMSQSR